MKLTIFQSDKGDCLLLESQDGHRILCDGGMSNSMTEHVSGVLGKLHKKKKRIDFAYISHIDQDHISGVLRLLRDELDWRVYDHHKGNGNTGVKAPKSTRPPAIGGIWHNAFRDQVGANKGDIEESMAAAVPALLGTRVPKLQEVGEELYQIATSIPEAVEVSKLVSAKVLGIPLNTLPGVAGPSRLLMVRSGQKPFSVGSMMLTIVGPTSEELNQLRKGWNNWLDVTKNAETIEKIDRKLKEKLDEFSSSTGAPRPIDLRDWNGIPDFKGVTTPNIASLMFMVEEDGKRLLLTGDSQQDIILKGLQATGYLSTGSLHVNVLKVQHHGSENNMDANFAKTVSADHYVFCGNGEHENPDLGVIDIVYQSRLGLDPKKRAKSPDAQDRPFKMWFSSNSAIGPSDEKARSHMVEVEKLVAKMVTGSKGKMKAHFNSKAFSTLKI